LSRGSQGRGVEIGVRRPVDVAAIERELRAAWTSADGPSGGTTRACTLNLVIVSEVDERPAAAGARTDLTGLIADITSEHPCRVFDVRLDPGAEALLRAGISAHRHRPAGSVRQVCCEQVTLEAGGAAVDDLPGSIGPLLVPDLPVFLWWRGEPPFAARRFERLTHGVDRLIVDSAEGSGSAPFVHALADWRRRHPRGAAPGDLNWRRLSAWRSLVAGLFDAPEDRVELERIHSVDIGWPTPGPGRLAARCFYMAGWLASRLGWDLLDSGVRIVENGLTMRAGGGRGVDLTLRGTGAGDGPCARSLTLAGGEGGDGWLARLEAPPGVAHATCRVRRAGRPDELRHEDLGVNSLARLVGRELESAGVDRVYEDALAAAGGIARLWMQAERGTT
jgi:glucose-6-phosphate dehydrogenase assembly protein OpcA